MQLILYTSIIVWVLAWCYSLWQRLHHKWYSYTTTKKKEKRKENETIKEKYKRVFKEKTIEAILNGNYTIEWYVRETPSVGEREIIKSYSRYWMSTFEENLRRDLREVRENKKIKVKVLEKVYLIDFSYSRDDDEEFFPILIDWEIYNIELDARDSEKYIHIIENISKQQETEIEIDKQNQLIKEKEEEEEAQRKEDAEYLEKLNELLEISPLDEDLKATFDTLNELEGKRKEVLHIQELYLNKVKEMEKVKKDLTL